MMTARITSPVAYELMGDGMLKSTRISYSLDFATRDLGDGVMLMKQRVGGTHARPLHQYFIQDPGDGSLANKIVRERCKTQKVCLRFIPVA